MQPFLAKISNLRPIFIVKFMFKLTKMVYTMGLFTIEFLGIIVTLGILAIMNLYLLDLKTAKIENS